MGYWNELIKLAREKHAQMLSVANGDASVEALLQAAEQTTGIQRMPVPAGDPLLDGGEAMLDIEAGIIWYNADLDPRVAHFYQAHEYAHLWIDGANASCSTDDMNPEAILEVLSYGVQRVEGYSPQERRERRANVFAREFLLPSDILRAWFAVEGLNASGIAARVGLLEGMVLHQLTLALLAPADSDEAPVQEEESAVDLDPSQSKAAHVKKGPLLVEAGPGTGKTRTLVGRVLYLLNDKGVSPSNILALTFSNKAAEEMRNRVAHVVPDKAPHIWMGTFHAFGLELLRKYGSVFGLPPRPAVLDPVEAVFLLEQMLPQLGLKHYQNLYEPTTYLRDILGAISRAKDELVGPAEYTTLAQRMYEQASTPDEQETAEKALEVARVYTLYQEYLEREHVLDFGDLIMRTVQLLRRFPGVRTQIRQAYRHILVDEYQDVNRASAIFLQELAGSGENLWVVGDVRQAIYRFRGAAPMNVRQFDDDFKGAARRSLERNYRSQPPILDVFAALAPQMLATRGMSFTPWEPHRAHTDGSVSLAIAENLDAEIVGLARSIEQQRANGIRYRDQAILCRSHTSLARLAAGLERMHIPIFYLGDIFERPEIRDLLSLLSLACEGNGNGLLRVARFPEYQIPLADVRALLALASEQQVPFPGALALAQNADHISHTAKAAFQRLEAHLDGLCYGSQAWSLLAHYLFERSGYLRVLLNDTSVVGQQQRLAILQFLQFAHEQRGRRQEQGVDPKRTFLRYIRRLVTFNEDRQLRQIPAWADHLDAVRLMTIHAAKGLEFKAVYLPVLGSGYFPASRRPLHCPPPQGMLPPSPDDGHDEEEECLFFVALSRACDHLHISRAKRYSENRRSNPSSLLAKISSILNCSIDGDATWTETSDSSQASTIFTPVLMNTFDADALDRYIDCPRQFYYEFVLGLSGRREDEAYLLFHRCVYSVLRWLQAERAAGHVVYIALALQRLGDAWDKRGPRGHPYESIYRQSAEAIVVRAVSRTVGSIGNVSQSEWEVALTNGLVVVKPDHVEVAEDGSHILMQRFRTGQRSGSELERDIYALYDLAAEQFYPKAKRDVQVFYLSTNQPETVPLTPQRRSTRLTRYERAIEGIRRGAFPPKPDDRGCPRCPFFFVCPAAEDG